MGIGIGIAIVGRRGMHGMYVWYVTYVFIHSIHSYMHECYEKEKRTGEREKGKKVSRGEEVVRVGGAYCHYIPFYIRHTPRFA